MHCSSIKTKANHLSYPFWFGSTEKSFGSKWQINNLHRFGFSISSDEVTRFKHSAIEATEICPTDLAENETQNQFTQWVAVNVNHNLVTLTGKRTFHGMGIIAVSNLANVKISTVKRLKYRLKAADFAKDKGILVHYYSGSSRKGLLKIKFKPIQELRNLIVLPSELSFNLIWHSRWCLSSPETTQPNWLAYMQDVTSGFNNQRNDTIQFNSIFCEKYSFVSLLNPFLFILRLWFLYKNASV